MSVVLDASSTLAWYFDDERREAGDALMNHVARFGARAPPVWRYEVANGSQTAIRRRRIDVEYREASLDDLELMPIVIDPDADAVAWTQTLELSDRFGLTVYDAAYLELADRLALPLATQDRKPRAAAELWTVKLFDTAG